MAMAACKGNSSSGRSCTTPPPISEGKKCSCERQAIPTRGNTFSPMHTCRTNSSESLVQCPRINPTFSPMCCCSVTCSYSTSLPTTMPTGSGLTAANVFKPWAGRSFNVPEFPCCSRGKRRSSADLPAGQKPRSDSGADLPDSEPGPGWIRGEPQDDDGPGKAWLWLLHDDADQRAIGRHDNFEDLLAGQVTLGFRAG